MKWPPKREGACSNAPIPKLLNSPRNNSRSGFAQVCAHKFTVTQQEPLGRIHYSQEVCIPSQGNRMSPRQHEIVERLCREYLGGE